eukprot:1967-Pyramimonas_sp.AAC.1
MLSYYNPTAERLDYLAISIPQLTMTLGMNTIQKIFYISTAVDKLPCVRKTFDDFAYDNNKWLLGWTRCRHGPHRPHARALAK